MRKPEREERGPNWVGPGVGSQKVAKQVVITEPNSLIIHGIRKIFTFQVFQDGSRFMKRGRSRLKLFIVIAVLGFFVIGQDGITQWSG